MAEVAAAEGDVLDGGSKTTSEGSKTTTGGEASKEGSGEGKVVDMAKLQVALPEGWIDGLPEDLKAEPSLKLFKDFPSIVKSLVSSQKMIGKDKIVIPDSKLASKDDWKEVFSKLGLPEVAEKYEVKIEESLYEKGIFVKEQVEDFKKVAHELNILPSQLQGMLDWMGKQGEAAMEQIETGRAAENSEALSKYKKETGEKFEYHKARANQALKAYGGDEFVKFVKENGLGSSVPLIKFLASVGETLKEDAMVGRAAGGGPLLNPKEIQDKLNVIKNDMTHPYYIQGHPGHKQAQKEVEELYERLVESQSA